MPLLGNALKFTATGFVVVYARLLSLFHHEEEEDGSSPPPASSEQRDNTRSLLLQVRVEDTGEGIPVDRLDDLFEEFTQADSSVSRRHGECSGLCFFVVFFGTNYSSLYPYPSGDSPPCDM